MNADGLLKTTGMASQQLHSYLGRAGLWRNVSNKVNDIFVFSFIFEHNGAIV